MVPPEVAPLTVTLKLAATWAAFGGLAAALLGLVLELSGAHLLASAFQPFVLSDFAKLAIKKFGPNEAGVSFAGLSLICVGISLQILSVVLLIVVEVLRVFAGH